ncbi:MAG: hypothetical protein KJ023_07830 [Burkholderiaceae bacterium]|nr:hypothetical protein [Burkholderiaceae bacterium]
MDSHQGFDKLSPHGEQGFDKLSPNGEQGFDKLSPNGLLEEQAPCD